MPHDIRRENCDGSQETQKTTETSCCKIPIIGHTETLVVYLTAADILSRPLPSRLRRLIQPVMSPLNRFSTPHLLCLACLETH